MPPDGSNQSAERPVPDGALSYATPPGRGPRVWAGIAVMFAALGLVFLGGCFMIGVMAINSTNVSIHSSPPVILPKSAGQIILECILYVIALACFGGAIYLFGLALGWLRKIVFS